MVYKPGYIRISLMIILILVGGLEHEVYFFRYWECHHPNWRTHIFQRGWNHQPGNNMGNIWKQNHEKYMETICPKKHIKRILRKKREINMSTCADFCLWWFGRCCFAPFWTCRFLVLFFRRRGRFILVFVCLSPLPGFEHSFFLCKALSG